MGIIISRYRMFKFAFALLIAAVSANESEMELEGAPRGHYGHHGRRSYAPYGQVRRGTTNHHSAPGYYHAPKPKHTSYNYAPKPKAYSHSWNPKPLQSDWKDGDGYSHKSGIVCQNGVCKAIGKKGTSKDNHGGNYSNPDAHGLGLGKGGDGYGDYG